MKDLECRYHRFRGDGSPTAQSGLKPVNSADGSNRLRLIVGPSKWRLYKIIESRYFVYLKALACEAPTQSSINFAS